MGAPPPRARRPRRAARRGADSRASPFNPVIVLRRSPPADADADGSSSPAAATGSSFELFYDDGAGSGLRPLPESMSDFLMGSGFERLLEQLAQMEAGGGLAARARDAPPASKAAVDSMPALRVGAAHVAADAHCAVCKEAFELGAEAREMPCAHIYHADCILPWLALRNSCPVCRHEMPADNAAPRAAAAAAADEDARVGLTIWRLPGGGFAVGRFAGGPRPDERELPVVYTEMESGFNFNSGHAPRRISWGARQAAATDRGTVRRFLRSVFACFGRGHAPSAAAARAMPELNDDDVASDHSAAFSRGSRSRSTSWRLEDGRADAMVQR
jgi:E3 ubiquitin-protein ligase RNF115/126